VGLRTIEHDFQSRFSGRPAPIFDGDAGAIQSLRGLVPSEAGFALHFGDVASGDEDIVSVDRAQAPPRGTGGLAVAAEAAGGGPAGPAPARSAPPHISSFAP